MGFRCGSSYLEHPLVYEHWIWRESCVKVHVQTHILEDLRWIHCASDVHAGAIACLLQIKVKASHVVQLDPPLIFDVRREPVLGNFRCE